jgi:hypothetical protein
LPCVTYTDVSVHSSSQIIGKWRIYATLIASGKPAIKPKLSKMRDCVSAAIVTIAIGAIAGGEMILSHVDGGQASVATHTLVAPAQAQISAPAAQPHPQPIVDSTMDSRARVRLGAAVHESSMNPKIVEPAAIAPQTEVGPSDASVKVATPPRAVAAPATKIRRVARHVERTVGAYGAWGWGSSRSY